MKHVGELFGAEIWMKWDDDVRIVIEWRPKNGDQMGIRGLGEVLGGFARMSYRDDVCRAEICYTESLDRRLCQLIDLLISLRYSHPTVTQLKLNLTSQEAEELEEILK